MDTSRKSAFTLIELLVVIAIIAILVSILMPSLSKSKDIAREISCRQNQRNIYLVLRLYGNDYDNQLPNASGIMERQWQGWDWRTDVPSVSTAHDVTFLPHKLMSYMPHMGNSGWYCPGWPDDMPYQSNIFVNGTPTNPWAGAVPGTQQNFGMGYLYTAGMGIHWGDRDNGHNTCYEAVKKVNFDRAVKPSRAKVMSCLLPQQVNTPNLGDVGPHHKGTIWDILWLDGSITTTKGFWGYPQSFEMYCNYWGDNGAW